ncbi:hypothetical protein DRW07_00815 [Alteromonas sediminis]|uniref:Uncharacterized protein n=1 Tax=Alteromonas sediminis TaxID=2259342 RepID=A0A3N5ZDA9_9ALTE|nr:hypothetical protein [Alteromonas sediminis]RPJ67988.1 hypothetical protein DRW07_00815 [Alteromonas sediminis]
MNKISLTLVALCAITAAFFAGRWSFSSHLEPLPIATQHVSQSPSHANIAPPAITKSCIQDVMSENHEDSGALEENEKIEQLNAQLLVVKGQLQNAYRKIDEAYALMQEAGLQQPDSFDNSIIHNNLPEPFKSAMLSHEFSIKTFFAKYIRDKRDESWAPYFENQIQDFYTLHELGHHVKLDAVICKTTFCEIRGFDIEVGANNTILEDMQRQSWFNALTSSMTQTAPPSFRELEYINQFHILIQMRDK